MLTINGQKDIISFYLTAFWQDKWYVIKAFYIVIRLFF